MSSKNESCPICAETFTTTVRSEIHCSGCELVSCKECCKRYILSQSNDPHCMKCKQKWTREFMFENFGRGFVNTTYKQHKKELLFDIEKSKISATMPRVEAYKEVAKLENYQKEISQKIIELNTLLRDTRNERTRCYYKINRLKNKPFSKPKEFRHHCPVDNCKGFLSTQWKCPVCTTWACSKCHQIIGLSKDEPHVCKKEDIDSVEEIKKTTKPCPTCAIPIQKSVGCNQMWCTQCQVAFDWKTGEIQNGVIHNPHFFEAKREGMIRAPGDNVCGGLPNFWDWDNVIKLFCRLDIFDDVKPSFTIRNKRNSFNKRSAITYRIAGENVDVINGIRRQVAGYNGQKMETARIQYITGIIDEKKFKTMISTQENSREKRQANLDILEIYNTVTIENFQGLIGEIQDFFQINISQLNINDDYKFLDSECETLGSMFDRFNKNILRIRDYVNMRAIKIGYYYNQSIHIVNEAGGIQTRPKVSKTELFELTEYYKQKKLCNTVSQSVGGVTDGVAKGGAPTPTALIA